MKSLIAAAALTSIATATFAGSTPSRLTYPIVDTGQRHIFDNTKQLRHDVARGGDFDGQDGHYRSHPARYRDNRDGTIDDLVTGLTWLKKPHTGEKLSYDEAVRGASSCKVGGHRDWRLPSAKELYSLIDFNGCINPANQIAYLDTDYFEFQFGRAEKGERAIDSQYWTCDAYVGRVMGGQRGVFGVNFADGRIKCYARDRDRRGRTKTNWTLYCRGNPAYGKNDFADNGDGTITDRATGLMWLRADAGRAMTWQEALAWCEKLNAAGHDDWRLPNAKELHSLLAYDRVPAIDPIFEMTDKDAWYHTSTTHLDGLWPGDRAVYLCFGKAMGYLQDQRTSERELTDVHGAGAQRSDPKSGDPNSEKYRDGLGPQGDEIRILNHVRPVRNVDASMVERVKPELGGLPIESGGGGTHSDRGGWMDDGGRPSGGAERGQDRDGGQYGPPQPGPESRHGGAERDVRRGGPDSGGDGHAKRRPPHPPMGRGHHPPPSYGMRGSHYPPPPRGMRRGHFPPPPPSRQRDAGPASRDQREQSPVRADRGRAGMEEAELEQLLDAWLDELD